MDWEDFRKRMEQPWDSVSLALAKRIALRPKVELTEKELAEWAERLAADVANARD